MGRVYDIMRRDSNKDPDTFPNALLAKVLLGQVSLDFKFQSCANY